MYIFKELITDSVMSSAQSSSISGTEQCYEYSDFSRIVVNIEYLFKYGEDLHILILFLYYTYSWHLMILKSRMRGITLQVGPFMSNFIRTNIVYSYFVMFLHFSLEIVIYTANERIETQKIYKGFKYYIQKRRSEEHEGKEMLITS